MTLKLKPLFFLLLSLLIINPIEVDAARKNYKKYSRSYGKKKYSKKKYSKKRYTKKKYSKKRYAKKRVSKKRVVSNYYHVPTNYAVYGMDVSRYQGAIDWSSLASTSAHKFNINFAFIKATEGGDRKDHKFIQNWENAAANGVKRGAYHFYRPGSDPYIQAQNFISSVKLRSGDLPPVIDVEARGLVSEQRFRDDLLVFANLLEKAYGIKPIIYTGYRFYHKHLSHTDFSGYHFWVAHYGKKDLTFQNNWKFWQFTCKGRIKGIKAKVDLNVFKGTLADLNALCLK